MLIPEQSMSLSRLGSFSRGHDSLARVSRRGRWRSARFLKGAKEMVGKAVLVAAILGVAAIPVFADGSNTPYDVHVPSLGNAKVNCFLAKEIGGFLDGIPMMIGFDNGKIGSPFYAEAVLREFSGQPKSVNAKIVVTAPDGSASNSDDPLVNPNHPDIRVAALGGVTLHYGGARELIPNTLAFWHRFNLEGMTSGTYRFDFLVDGINVCGGALNGSQWTRNEALK